MAFDRANSQAKLEKYDDEALCLYAEGMGLGMNLGGNLTPEHRESMINQVLDAHEADATRFAAKPAAQADTKLATEISELSLKLETYSDETLGRMAEARQVALYVGDSLSANQRSSLVEKLAKGMISDAKAFGSTVELKPAVNIDYNSDYAKTLKTLPDAALAAVGHGEGVSAFETADKLSDTQRDALVTRILTVKTESGVLAEAAEKKAPQRPKAHRHIRPSR